MKTVIAEVASLKRQVARADTGKTDSNQLVAEMLEELGQRMMRLKLVIVGCNPSKKLTCALVIETVSAVDSVVQWLGYNAVSRLR